MNAQLADAPELVNNNSFDEGWMIKLKASDLAPLNGLMDSAAYEAMIQQG